LRRFLLRPEQTPTKYLAKCLAILEPSKHLELGFAVWRPQTPATLCRPVNQLLQLRELAIGSRS
ncbi:MAG: hypothetical protein ACK53L_05950, partial [Pirellulaceae bacterium]